MGWVDGLWMRFVGVRSSRFGGDRSQLPAVAGTPSAPRGGGARRPGVEMAEIRAGEGCCSRRAAGEAVRFRKARSAPGTWSGFRE